MTPERDCDPCHGCPINPHSAGILCKVAAERRSGKHAAPAHWELPKDAVLAAAGLRSSLPFQGDAKQSVSKAPRGIHEADDRRCVGVAKELVKMTLSKRRWTGSPSYRIYSEMANSACPHQMRGGEGHLKHRLAKLLMVRVQT